MECEFCGNEMTAGEYLSPLWQGDVLLPAVVIHECACGHCEYAEAEYRGERLYSYPPIVEAQVSLF